MKYPFLEKVRYFFMYSIISVCKQPFRISKVHTSTKVKGVVMMRNLRYSILYMKANVLQDFHI